MCIVKFWLIFESVIYFFNFILHPLKINVFNFNILRPPSASLVLWRKPRNPPSVAACALDPVVDATAAARSELRSRLPFTAVHRMVHRPQHLHGSSPLTLDARVPAIQRPSARSLRTVDNSLITRRIEYSTFLNLPLDECIVNTPPECREVIKREARSEELKQVTKSSERQE